MKKPIQCILLVLLFMASTKTQQTDQLPAPGFIATIDGNQRSFKDYTMAFSQKNSTGQSK